MQNLKVEYVPITELKPSEYNPRRWSTDQLSALKESIVRFGCVDPVIANGAPGRKGILIGGHMRLVAIKELGHTEVPVIFLNIPDLKKEREINVRLNKNQGEFDLELLKSFDESFLKDVGFDTTELDSIFDIDPTPEKFDLKKELAKLNINEVTVRKGDIYEAEGFRLMCGDSTIETDVLKLMGDERADMVMTDPPYRLSYLTGKKRNGKPTEGFGLKRDRKYLETDELPADFTEKWTGNVAKIAKPDFSIICYENWKNLREVWGRWKSTGKSEICSYGIYRIECKDSRRSTSYSINTI